MTGRDRDLEHEAPGLRLSDVPWPAWIFVLLALGNTVRLIRNSNVATDQTIESVVVLVLGLAPVIASILLPAALLVRHPNAARVAPGLLLGTILVAAVQGMQVLVEPLQPLFESLTPAGEEIPDFVPMTALYRLFIFLVLVFGLANISLGLSRARRFEDAARDLTGLIIPVATVLATVAGVVELSGLGLFDVSLSPVYLLFLASVFIPGIVQVGAWAYLLTVTTRGLRAGEEPDAGWRLGVLAGVFAVGTFFVIYGVRLLDLEESLGDLYLYTVAITYALGYLSLLLAFWVGLPAIDDEEIDDAEDVDEADDDVPLDEDGWPIATG